MVLKNHKYFKVLIVVVIIALAISSYVLFSQQNSIPDSKNNIAKTEDTLASSLKIKNENILSGYSNKSNIQLMQNILSSKDDVELSKTDYLKISHEDAVFFSTNSKSGLPYQRYTINVSQNLINSGSVNVTWQGNSSRMVDLYAWNFNNLAWSKLSTSIERSKNNLSLIAKLDTSIFVKDNISQLMVAPALFNEILPGKVATEKDYDFTFAWLSDTQYYSASYPNIYDKMTKYLVDNKKNMNIEYAIHTGDLVDSMEEDYQWKNADKSMSLLDKAELPYGVVSGNHDVGHTAGSYAKYFEYFGANRFSSKPYFGGSLNNNRDHYDLISTGGNDYLIMYIGWTIQDSTIEWANSILKKYPKHKAIIATHGYMSSRGSYVEQGKVILEKIVTPNSNVFMVLCGHYGGAATNVKRVDGRVYYEMIANYQFNPEGGAGYLRLLYFDTKNNLVYVNTYSPHLNDYNFFDKSKEEFILPLNDEKGDLIINTDYININ